MAKHELRQWAVKGAEQRLLEIAEEAKVIYATFPELRGKRSRAMVDSANAPENAGGSESGAPRRRKRRKMSRDARRRISEAQKARWAKQRTAAANPAATTAATKTSSRAPKKK